MKLLDMLLALIMCLSYATDYIVSKETLEFIPPIMLSALRFGIVALCTLPFCKRIPSYLGSLFLLSFAVSVLTYGFADIGIHLNSSATVANLIMECNIVLSIIFASFFLNEKVSKKTIIGTIIAFFGVALIVIGNSISFKLTGYEFNKNNILSILALSVAVCAWPVYTISAKKLEKELSTVEIIAWTALIGSLQSLLISVIFEYENIKAISGLDTKNIILIIYTGIGGVIIPHKIFHYLIRNYDVTRVSSISLFVPLFVAVGSFFVFHERLGAPIFIGGLFITIGVYFTNSSVSKNKSFLEVPQESSLKNHINR